MYLCRKKLCYANYFCRRCQEPSRRGQVRNEELESCVILWSPHILKYTSLISKQIKICCHDLTILRFIFNSDMTINSNLHFYILKPAKFLEMTLYLRYFSHISLYLNHTNHWNLQEPMLWHQIKRRLSIIVETSDQNFAKCYRTHAYITLHY